MNKIYITKILSFILSAVTTISCSKNEETAPIGSNSDEVEFYLDFGSRAPEDGNDADGNSTLEDYAEYFKEGESCVLISQRAGSLQLDFTNSSSNCYKYTYYENPAANWESLYNFRSERALSWERVEANGQYANGFAFGALYFPRDYNYTDEINDDQSTNDLFYESDILGAYHSTSNRGDRLKFRLYHLMCKLRVNLYVPVWDDEASNGFNADEVRASTISFQTQYTIEWGQISTEQYPTATPLSLGIVKDIKMFLKESEEEPLEIDLANYNITEPSKDKVRRYSFEVLFPKQSVTGNFLKFTIVRAGIEYDYYFRSDNLTNNSNGFTFNQGEVTLLELYLPRTDNDILLIEAKINKWNESESSFTITPELND